jgi:Na+/H+ antiporter NhaD/arsenite permease-like protein
MDFTILIPIAFFAMVAAIVILPSYFRSREKERLHETLRAAYEKGQPVPPEMIEALQIDRPKAPQPDRDLRRGIVLLCVAAAIVVFAATIGQFEDHDAYSFAAVAAFPGFIGIGYIAFWLASRRKSVA